MKNVISWFANNAVAANLAMLIILIGGFMVLPLFERKIIPEITFDIIEIHVPMPGAGPTQVERSVTRRIEQSLVGIEGILDINSQAKKNVSNTALEISNNVPISEVINKVRARVEAVSLPNGAGRPIVREVVVIEPVIALALSGNVDLYDLNHLAEILVAQLRFSEGVHMVYVRSAPRREFLVELSQNALQRFNVAYTEIISALRSAATDIAGASMETSEGDVSIIGESKISDSTTLESLVIRSQPDGARLYLNDLANIEDNYRINETYNQFNGKNVVYIGINRSQDEDLLTLAKKVENFVKASEAYLPEGVKLEVSNDVSKEVSGRIDLLTNNAIGGFLLVLFILLLFMNLRLSFWTSLGIPISFLGAFLVLYYMGASLNMVSLFAFILVLGIVVDDAIIVGESIHSQHEKNNFGIKGSLDGTFEVYKPVLFAVITTMVAFSPMLFMPGEEGRLVFIVPVVVISVLAFSLIESLLILPSHLSMIGEGKHDFIPLLNKAQQSFSGFLGRVIKNQYSPMLERALYWRYATAMIFIMVFLICCSLVIFRWVNVQVVSEIESDIVIARMQMLNETPEQETIHALQDLEQAAFTLQEQVNKELGFEQITHIASSMHPESIVNASVSIYLNVSEQREISGAEIEQRLTELFGDVPNVKWVQTRSNVVNTGPQIDIELTHFNITSLKPAVEELLALLKSYQGVEVAWNTINQGDKEVNFSLKEEAGDLGISDAQVATQIRQAFHGDLMHLVNDNGDQVPVKVAYPEEQRSSLWFLENLPIRLKDGSTVPLYSIANLHQTETPSVITLHGGQRSLRVKAKLEDTVSEAQIMAALRRDFLNDVDQLYPGMTWKRAGGQKRSQEILDYLSFAYPLSLLVMYLLMATLFASYFQPLMIMGAIPFGVVGAMLGHLLMGVELTLWSLVGIIAVSGVVVNDNLVLVDRINNRLKEGEHLLSAIREAGVSRFRPIVLTSLTTFLGLAPLMFENSMQAQFLIPMAVSLAYGVLFATVISLVLVPVFYAILFDLQTTVENQNFWSRMIDRIRHGLGSDT